jgi:hypothetical protein
LIDAFGFDKNQVYFYTDQKATRDNILRALRAITSQGEPGDVACFYYSGHGARVKAVSGSGHGDSDLYYETIIPASGSWISDWEIAEIANDLQPSVVNFTVLLDSCHSGGMHPSDALSKVRSPIFSEPLFNSLVGAAVATLIPFGLGLPSALALQLLKHNVSNLRKSTQPANGMVDLDPDPAKTLIDKSKATLIAGCQFDELSWEHASLQHGVLTRSLIDLVDRR